MKVRQSETRNLDSWLQQLETFRVPVLSETLQEIGSYLDGEPDLDELVRLVLRGVHRGVRFDRVFFGLLTPDRLQLEVRHALGGDCRGAIAMPADGKPNLLQAVLRSGKALWVSDENRPADLAGPREDPSGQSLQMNRVVLTG
jgi:transcriptional regulator with GAF, ATPase, and Fis domain